MSIPSLSGWVKWREGHRTFYTGYRRCLADSPEAQKECSHFTATYSGWCLHNDEGNTDACGCGPNAVATKDDQR